MRVLFTWLARSVTIMLVACSLSVSIMPSHLAQAAPGDARDTSSPNPAASSGTTPDDRQVTKNNRCRVAYDKLTEDNCLIIKYIVLLTNAISGIAGIIIAGSIILAGIQYSTAQANPQVVAEARKRIRNSILALLLFAFAYAILMWLIPGGTI